MLSLRPVQEMPNADGIPSAVLDACFTLPQWHVYGGYALLLVVTLVGMVYERRRQRQRYLPLPNTTTDTSQSGEMPLWKVFLVDAIVIFVYYAFLIHL
jgi:type VI protein secretion system component VasF